MQKSLLMQREIAIWRWALLLIRSIFAAVSLRVETFDEDTLALIPCKGEENRMNQRFVGNWVLSRDRINTPLYTFDGPIKGCNYNQL